MRRALSLLARLEQQKLDQRRLALRAVDDKLAAGEAALAELRAREPLEHAAAWTLPGGPAPLAAYLGRTRRQETRLKQELEALTAARAAAEAELRDGLAARRSLELAAERIGAAEAGAAARRAEAALEEQAARRTGNDAAPGGVG
jgi:hypothetical protein